VQKAHRFAFIAISLTHSGHFLVVGSSGASLFDLTMSALIGRTTKKYIAQATIIKEIRAFKKFPYINLLPLIVNIRFEKSGALIIAPIRGVRMF
jgi:hypothetical protein